MEEDFSSKVPFLALCDLFERLFLSGKPNHKKKLLQTFFQHYRSTNFHPLMRLLLPQLDKERQTYGMKETNLGKYYVTLLNISPESDDGKRLLHWRRPTKQGEMEAGDFGNAVFLSLEKRCPTTGVLSLAHVNKCLDKLNSSQDKKDKVTVLKWMLRKSTAREQKWFVRIIIKELKIGVSEKTVLNSFHPDALELFQATSSLQKVSTQLHDPAVRLKNEGNMISLFNPIKPQLAARKNPEGVVEAMNGSPFVIETKFDGERIQVHKDGDVVRLYSRNSNEVTSIYGKKIIPIILKHIKSTQCILDGELLVWDAVTQKYEDFGKLKTFANFEKGNTEQSGDIGSNIGKQLCYIVFDVLMVNEKSVMDLTLEQRMLLVKRCVDHSDKLIEIVHQQIATTTQEIVNALDAAIMNREEGIMVKNLHSSYVPGERKEKWIKLKPEYIEGVVSDMDLLIIGGYYGSGIGRRGGKISHFLLGVAAPSEDVVTEGDHENGVPQQFLSFCKVGSGYSDQELKILQKMLEKYWRVYDVASPPDCIKLVPPFKEKPDVWIDPKKSRILQIKAAQIVPSEKFMTRHTLRFPRVQKIRLDKMWHDAMDWNELQEICKQSHVGRTSKRLSEVDANQSSPKRKKTNPRKSFTVLAAFQAAETNDLCVISSLFAAQEFCILSGTLAHSKASLERLIFQQGGMVVQYPTIHTSFVIADKKTLRIENLIQTSRFDIIRPAWVIQSIDNNMLVPLEPRFMLFTTPKTEQTFLNTIDAFGDHYTKDVTPEVLSQLLSQIPYRKEYKECKMSPSALHSFEIDCFPNTPWWGIFRTFSIYVDRFKNIGDVATVFDSELDLIPSLASFYGAEIVHSIQVTVTHVIIDPTDTIRLPLLQKYRKKHSATFYIVTKQWLLDCIEQHEDLDEGNYSP